LIFLGDFAQPAWDGQLAKAPGKWIL